MCQCKPECTCLCVDVCVCLCTYTFMCIHVGTVVLARGDRIGKRTTKEALERAGRKREPSFVMLFKSKSIQETICTNLLE